MADENFIAQLVPVLPTVGDAVSLAGRRRFVIGKAPDADVRVREAGVQQRHCILECPVQRWLIVDGDGAVSVNGKTTAGPRRLLDGEIIAISATLRWEFVSGEPRTEKLPVAAASEFAKRRHRKRLGLAVRGRRMPWTAMLGALAVLFFIGLAAYTITRDREVTTQPASVLSEQEAVAFDSLLNVAYDHLERGNSLLELGLPDEATLEFARGVNTLALSALRSHPLVKPRIEALETVVAAIYRERMLTVPEAFSSSASTLTAETIRSAALTREQFVHAFDLVAGAFQFRFRKPIVVVGRDHAEHVSLYGKGGALDLRSNSMTMPQLAFVIAQCHAYGIRVKDFSQDSILQRQVRAAIRAGHSERAGTGLHLHVDRFADRHDQWTLRAPRR